MSQASRPQKVIDNTSKPIQDVQSASNNDKNNKARVKQLQRANKPKENITVEEDESKLVTDLNMKERGKSPSMKDKHDLQKQAHKVPEISNSLSASRLQKIQSEKQTIQNQLKKLDKEINQIRQEERSKSILHRREEISNNRQARKIAISLVKNHRARKRQFQEKKKAHDEKTLQFLKQQFEQASKKKQQHDKLAQQQKRRVISLRMNEGKKQVQERKEFQKLSNQLINRLLKEEEMLRQKSIESPIQESEPIRVVERIPQIDFIQIEKHEQAYLQRKEELAKKKEGSITVSHPTKKYEKTRWAEKLEEVQQRQREEERQKELERQLKMQKRMKYGQLIHSLFVKKNKVRTENSLEKANINSQSILVTPNKQRKPRQSIKKGRDSFIKSNPNTVLRQQKKQLSPQQIQQKDNRQRQLRKQTVQRLRKIESSDIKNGPQHQAKYQSKYQNYLGQVKRKKKDDSQIWSNILNNKDMSKEQKYASLLNKAIALENKAKFKESLHKENPDEAVELYLDSIQAKLTLLQNI